MTLTCVFVGGSLSLAGLQIQTITNNALASPYTLGITASASFGAAIAITLGLSVAGYLWDRDGAARTRIRACRLPPHFLFGAPEGDVHEYADPFGIIMNFFFQALQQYLQYRASPEIAQIISGWTFGNLATLVVDERRRKWLFVGNGCGAPVRLVLASHRTDDG